MTEFCTLNEPLLRCADVPENELQHDVFAVQGEKSPEEAQRYHAELQHTQIRKQLLYESQIAYDIVKNMDFFC